MNSKNKFCIKCKNFYWPTTQNEKEMSCTICGSNNYDEKSPLFTDKDIIEEYSIPRTVLNGDEIDRMRKQGEIVIEPFSPQCVNTSSYDVTLGKYYFRQKSHTERLELGNHSSIYNPYSDLEKDQIWKGPQEAIIYMGHDLKGISNGPYRDSLIWISPGETVLCHTNEFIGGKTKFTTQMQARSTVGRIGIEVCKCAGWGDVGYYNRWTMEITNNSNYVIPLKVGMRIAQIVFIPVNEIQSKDSYNKNGKYQTLSDVSEMMYKWQPEMMLPKMYKDKIVNF